MTMLVFKECMTAYLREPKPPSLTPDLGYFSLG